MRAAILMQKDHKVALQLSFTESESRQLEWENDDEFGYQGEMYDLIERKIEGGRLVLTCISDSKETALLQDYHRNSKTNTSGSNFAQLIASSFLLPKENSIIRPVLSYTSHFRRYSTSLLLTEKNVVCPPPDVC